MDQAVEDFEHCLDSIPTYSMNTPELDASLQEAEAIPSSVFWGFHAQLVLFLIFLIQSYFLVSNLISYGAQLEVCLCLFHRQVKCQLL